MTASDRINGIWRDKTTGREFHAGGAMVGYLYSQPERFERIPERRYHVVAINERTGRKDYLTATPDTHAACCTILSKQTPHKDVRKQLEEAPHA